MIEPASDGGTHHWFSLHTWLIFFLALLVVVDVAKGVVELLSPCNVHNVVRGVECPKDSKLVERLTQVGMILGIVGLGPDFYVKFWWVVRMQQHRPAGKWLSWLPGIASGAQPDADHWVAAATRSFFVETSRAVHSSHAFATLLLLPAFLLAISTLVVDQYETFTRDGLGSPPYMCIQDRNSLGCCIILWRHLLLQVCIRKTPAAKSLPIIPSR